MSTPSIRCMNLRIEEKKAFMNSTFIVDLERLSRTANIGIVLLCIAVGIAGYFVSFYFHFLTVTFFLLVLLNTFWRHGQTQ